MGCSFPFFFLMKKKGAVYGLLDGCIIPYAICSFRNLESLPCSNCKSYIVLPVSVGGAPGFKSMAWSQGYDGGSLFPFCCLNTSLKSWYWRGTLSDHLGCS